MINKTVVISTGSFLPENTLSNSDLIQFPPSIIPLIAKKTGVNFRKFADDSQCTSDLAIIAASRCLTKAGIDPLELDALILATSSPDRIQPATATRVQNRIGATRAFAFDINFVCSGGILSLNLADSLIKSNFCKNVLVVAAEIYSKYLNPSDFSTYPYFGDGAGAVLLSSKPNTDRGIIHSILRTDGSRSDAIQIPAGGTMQPYQKLKNPKDIYFKMIGKEIFDFAIDKGTEVISEILQETGVSKDDIKYVISHQANINIIKEIAFRLEINPNKFPITLDKYGNTAAASIFITLDELFSCNSIDKGDLILLVAFGGGLSWGANLIKI